MAVRPCDGLDGYVSKIPVDLVMQIIYGGFEASAISAGAAINYADFRFLRFIELFKPILRGNPNSSGDKNLR